MSSNNSRRDFLKQTLMASPLCMNAMRLSPFALFLESIVKKAYGIEDALDSNSNNYVGIMMTGGPPRWMFDLPLRPNGSSDPFIESPMVCTQIVNNQLKYQQSKIGQYYMPAMWDKYIPQVNGSRMKMSDLLQNMMMFRGYNLGVDGHSGNQIRHFRPNTGGTSIDGELGSESSRPIPNVACGASYGYSSPTGSSQISVSLSDSNPLNTLLSNFSLTGDKNPITMTDSEIEDAFDQVLKSMEKNAHENNIPLKNAYANRINAKKVFKEEYGNLKTWYDTRFNEYRDLERTCFTDSSLSLGAGIQEHDFYQFNQSHGLPDNYYKINNINQRDTHLPSFGVDLEQSLQSSTYVYAMAHTLTIAEFLIQNKLTSSMTLQWSSLRNLRIGTKNINTTNDGHNNGAMTSMFMYSKYYQAIAAGLNEFRTFLEGIGEFDKSVIQLSGDFNRSARYDGRGSDHAWMGTNTTVLSGMIKDHAILGNCSGRSAGTYKGSWGEAAGMDFLGGSHMAFGHVASSIATMLDCNSTSENNPSLVSKDSRGEVKPIAGVGAKNV